MNTLASRERSLAISRLMACGALFASLLSYATNTKAGDSAAIQPIGFSRTGHYFAFEQYGTESVSAMDYSQTWFVDLRRHRMVGGAPASADSTAIRDGDVRPGQDSLAFVRRIGRARSGRLRRGLHIGRLGRSVGVDLDSHARHPGLVLADRGDGRQDSVVRALEGDAHATMALDRKMFGGDARLALTSRELTPQPANCRQSELIGRGFSLVLERPHHEPVELLEAVPIDLEQSCPLAFGLSEAHALRHPDDSIELVVLVQRFQYSMEGNDRRFTLANGRVK
jgi:predicted secreted protein